jgi:hypothetical protein
MGIEPTSQAWELAEMATYGSSPFGPICPQVKERYWLRSGELVHGANMIVMPQLGVRISWRERCEPGPRHFLVFLCLYVRIRLGRLNFFVGSNPVPSHKCAFNWCPILSRTKTRNVPYALFTTSSRVVPNSLRIAAAALRPGTPVTEPPGGVHAPV